MQVFRYATPASFLFASIVGTAKSSFVLHLTQSMALATLSLSKATPEQTLETRKRTHVHWNRGLDNHQYLQRETMLDDFEHAKDGKLTTW